MGPRSERESVLTHKPLPEPVIALPGEVDAGDVPVQQDFGIDPLAVRHTDHYRREYVGRLLPRSGTSSSTGSAGPRARATSSLRY